MIGIIIYYSNYYNTNHAFVFVFKCLSRHGIKGASGPGGPEFAEFKEAHSDTVAFHTSLDALPPVAEGMKGRLALISGRTGDNPRLLGESIKVSWVCIYVHIYIYIYICKYVINNAFPVAIIYLPISNILWNTLFDFNLTFDFRLDVLPSILKNLEHQLWQNLKP